MKFLFILLLLISGISYGQSTYYIRADTTRLQKVGGNNELILENSTKSTTGVLVNYGSGHTRFSKPRISGDTLFVGVDTIYGVGGSGITQLTGDVTAGPGSGSQAATLANTAVTPGSYTNVSATVDAKGRITAMSSGGGGSGAIPYTWIFLLTGQSNGWGANDANQLDTSSNSRVQVWQHAQTTPSWQTFRINQRPLRTSGYNSADGGNAQPGYNGSNNEMFYFAKKFAALYPNDTVKVIMAIGDGSSITNWWSGGTKQRYLDSLTTRMDASGIDHVDGFVWHQGENNNSSFSGIYKESFDSIKNTLRNKPVFKKTTPIVVVGMPQLADGAGATYVGMDTLFRWMDRGDDMWVGYARTDSLVIDNNAVHYDTASIKKIGEERIWQAYFSLPHRFAELYDSSKSNVDSSGYVYFNDKVGTITESGGEWTMANNSYMVDTTHYILGDGFIEFDLSSTGIPVVGLSTEKNPEYYTVTGVNQYMFAAYANSANIVYIDGGNNTGGSIAAKTNVSKIKIQRIGSVTKMWIKVKDFYAPFFTYSSNTTDTLFPVASASGASVLKIVTQNLLPGNEWTKTQTDIVKETGGLILKGLKNAPGIHTVRVDADGNLTKTDTTSGSGGVSTATLPLLVTGSNISMTPASITDSGYVTTRTQTFNGNKTINGNFTVTPYSADATGGTITTSGAYTIHTFTTSGTFTPSGNLTVEYLVVAGGGSGGESSPGPNSGSGGGGAGAMLTGSTSVTATPYSITVGSGGVDGNGSNSVFSSITATGGGKGGNSLSGAGSNGSNGGSGGGGGGSTGGNGAAGTGTTGGNNGGNSYISGSSPQGGGGGGAGAVGGTGVISVSGNGGDGLSSSISGASVTYAGGGGGSRWASGGANGTGGAGGGGGGADGTGSNGTANTGGGGGAGADAGSGGSGIVIIRYLTPTNAIETDSNSLTKINKLEVLDSLFLDNTPITTDTTGYDIVLQKRTAPYNVKRILPGSVGAGSTDLSYTASPTNGIVVSSTGTDATIPLANVTNAGLLAPALFDSLMQNKTIHIVTGPSGFDQSAYSPNDSTINLKADRIVLNGTNVTPTVTDTTRSWAINTITESTYTPTLFNTTNIAASTAYTTYYTRQGDWVHVWGTVDIDATTGVTLSEMGMSLPVASAIGQIYDIAGTAAFEDNTSVQIKADVGNTRAVWRFTPQSATNNKYSFHFSYKYQAP